MGKIFINVHIFQNPSFVGVLFAVGLYGLGLIVRLKLFPFRIPWRPHNYQLSAMWPFGLFTLGLSTMDPSTIGSIVEQSVILNESVHLVSLNSLCMFDRFCLCHQVRRDGSVMFDFSSSISKKKYIKIVTNFIT